MAIVDKSMTKVYECERGTVNISQHKYESLVIKASKFDALVSELTRNEAGSYGSLRFMLGIDANFADEIPENEFARIEKMFEEE